MILEQLLIGYHKECPLMAPLNIELDHNQLTIILGENGKGKSTLLKTLSGQIPAIQGKVLIENKDLNTWDLSSRSKLISSLFSHADKNLNYYVKDYIALGRSPYTNWLHQLNEKDYASIDEVSKHLEVSHLMDRKVNEISDGEFQRVQIAQVLVQDTRYIFLDEVSSHLDLHHKIQVFKLLKSWAKKKLKTIVMVSHEINLALEFSDQLILLTKENTFKGSLDQLIASNQIQQLFNSDHLRFNLNSKRFDAVD